MGSRNALLGALYTILQPLLLSAVGLPATAYVIRSLGSTGYGQWAASTSLVGAVAVLTSFGMRPLFVRRVAQVQTPADIGEELAHQLGLRSLLGLGAGALIVALCFCLNYPSAVILCTAIAAFGLLLSAVSGVLADVLQGHQRLRPLAKMDLASGTALTALSVVAVWWGGGPVAVSIACLSGPGTSLGLLLCDFRRQRIPLRIRWSWKYSWKLLHEARLVGASQALGGIRDRAENLLVPKLVGITSYGYFTAGSLLADRLSVISSGLSTAFFPLIARNSQTDPKAASRHAARLILAALLVCLPVSLLIAFFADPIARILFPRNAGPCSYVIRLTIWSLPLMAIWQPMGFGLQAAHAHNEGARAGMLTGLCSILVSILLIGRFGLMGACLSWLARPAIGIVLYLRAFRHTFPSVFRLIPIARILLCSLTMAGVLWGCTRVLENGVLELILGGFIALVVYAAMSLLLRVVLLSDLKRLLGGRSIALAD